MSRLLINHEYDISHKTLSLETVFDGELMIMIENFKTYKHIGIVISPDEAIQLRNFLNEFIEANNE